MSIDPVPVPRNQPLPATLAQEWVLQLAGVTKNSIPVVLRFTGPLDLTLLRRSLTEIACRHESLRTSFRWEGGEAHLVIAPPAALPPAARAAERPAAARGRRHARGARLCAARPPAGAVSPGLRPRHAVLDADGPSGSGRYPAPCLQRRGGSDRLPDLRGPHPAGGLGADRSLHEHPGAAGRPVGKPIVQAARRAGLRGHARGLPSPGRAVRPG